ncbi:MAG: O-methyltransferase [Anaplasmataceae bacterium]|nr:O-methyltransferase [Anaplasmataceae bacterium]
MRKEVDKKTQYIKNLFSIEECDTLKKIKNHFGDDRDLISIGSEEANILKFFLQLHKSKKILEIGTLIGYSSIIIAKSIPDEGFVCTIEKDPMHYKIATQYIKEANLSEKIFPLLGEASLVLTTLTIIDFDVVFIDANKNGYCDYLSWCDKYLKKGALIIADNTFLFNKVYDNDNNEKTTENMRLFNERLSNKEKYTTILMPTNEGLTIAIKNF